jgi:hypothetical protein
VVLAALNIVAVGLGLGAGGLTATIAALLVGGVLGVAGLERCPDVGLVVGVLVGLAVAGWVAGRFAVHSERFHGAVTGLLMAGLVIVVARMGGSPAPVVTVIWLAVVSAGVAGTSGWLAGRQKRRQS